MERSRKLAGVKALQSSITQSPDRWVVGMWAVYVVVFLALSLMGHYTFRTGLDTSIYDHYVWNFARGEFLRNTIISASDIWNFYFAPLLIVFVPFYALWSDANVLLILQTLYLASSVFPIYWYARSQLGKGLGVLVAASFLMYTVLEHVNLAQFHLISMTVPLLTLSLYFLMKNRDKPFLICALLLMFVKEEALFAVMGLGLYVLIVRRKRALGLGMIAVAFAWLFLLLGYLFPLLTGRSYFFERGHLFGGLGSSVPEILQTMIYSPSQLLEIIFWHYNVEFLGYLFLPLALVPLAGLDVLLVGVPIIGEIFLTKTPWLASHYPSPTIPVMFFALVVGLRRLLTLKLRIRLPFAAGPDFNRIALAAAVGLASLAGYALLSPGPLGGQFDSLLIPDLLSEHLATLQEWVNLVPRDAVVMAGEETLPHFSARSYIYSFPLIPDYRQADYLVAKRGTLIYNLHQRNWDAMLTGGYFQTIFDRDGYLVAKRKDPEHPLQVRFGTDLRLLGYTLWPPVPWRGGMPVRPILTWQADRRIPERYSFALQIVDAQGHVWARQRTEPNDGATPTTEWQAGKPIGDQYTLNLPPTMPAGRYQLAIDVYNASGDYVEAFDAKSVSLGTGVGLATIQVDKDKESVPANQVEMGQRLYIDMAEMRFLGYQLDRQQYGPGDLVPLGLYWRARTKPKGDYIVKVQLRDSADRVVFEQSSRPAGGSYPTIQWDAGEVLLDWHDLKIPDPLPNGTYTLSIILFDSLTDSPLGRVDLPEITIGVGVGQGG